MMNTRALLFCLVLILAGGGACVRLGHKIPERTYYSISVSPPSQRAPADAPVLVFRPLSAQAPYDRSEFVYHLRPDQWKTDFYNCFLTPPADMLSMAVKNWMAGSGLFSHVVGPGMMIQSRLELEGSLQALYGDYVTDPPEAVLTVRLLLMGSGNKEERKVLLDRTYTEREPLKDRTRPTLIAGWTRATDKMLSQAVIDLRTAVPHN